MYTEEERNFAQEHFWLIQFYLKVRRLPGHEMEDELYERFMLSVHNYLQRPDLRRYSFATVAFHAMDSAMSHYFKREKKRRQDLCWNPAWEQIPEKQRVPEENLAATLLWHSILPLLSKEELDLVEYKAAGLSFGEIAELTGESRPRLKRQMEQLRKRIAQQIYIRKGEETA